jgi:hypothetical protein
MGETLIHNGCVAGRSYIYFCNVGGNPDVCIHGKDSVGSGICNYMGGDHLADRPLCKCDDAIKGAVKAKITGRGY